MTGLGLAPLFSKAALDAGAAPLPLTLASTAVAALAAVFMLRAGHAARLRDHSPGIWFKVLLVGALGSGAVVLLSTLAMTGTSATNRSLFQAMYPVATALCARALLGERLSRSAYAVILGMSLGLFLMNSGAQGLMLGPAFWMLAATLPLIGLSDVYAKRTLNRAEPRFVAAGRLVFGTLVLLGVLPFTTSAQWLHLTGEWPLVLAAGLAMSAGVLGLYRAMDSAGASLSAAFIALAPAVTAIGEWLLLDAGFSVLQLAGIALVVGGAVRLSRQV